MSKRIFSQTLDESFDRSAIPINKSEPELVDGMPVSGEDYLLVVRQQAQSCPKVKIAPPPKHKNEVKLPFHFQFNQTHSSDEKDQASRVWSQGFEGPFRSYQKFKQKTKDGKLIEVKNMEQGKELLYPEIRNKDHLSIASGLTQHSIIALLNYHISWLNAQEIEEQLSILRDVSRKCIELRSGITKKAPLNIIITIISQIFGQGDLK